MHGQTQVVPPEHAVRQKRYIFCLSAMHKLLKPHDFVKNCQAIHRQAQRLSAARAMLIVLLCGGTWLFAPSAWANRWATETGIKAAFLLNFARFTEWPAEFDDQHLDICLFRDNELSPDMASIAQGQTVGSTPIRYQQANTAQQLLACDLVYSASPSETRELLSTLTNQPVLTVGDGPGFIESGGDIELNLRNGRLQFRINYAAITQRGLNQPAKLLNLATEVIQ